MNKTNDSKRIDRITVRVCHVNAVREVPASYSRSEQMAMREDVRDIRVVAGYVEFRVVTVEETSTQVPTRSRGRRSRIRLVGNLVVVVRVVLMNHSDWGVRERALVGVIERQRHSHLLSMGTCWSLEIGFV